MTAGRLRVGLLLLALGSPAWGQPIRPTPIDVSVKNGGTGAYLPYQGHTANQTERDRMELDRIGIWFPRAILLCRQVPGCQYANVDVGMSRIFYTFFPIYVPRTIIPRGTWFLGDYGHYYNDEAAALNQIRGNLLTQPVACAAKISGDLQIVLNLSVKGGRCVAGNPAVRPALAGPVDTARINAQVIDTSKPVPALTPEQQNLVRETMTAHEANTRCHCHTGPCPGGDVGGAHLALEASALPGQEHFLQIPAFTGEVDPAWTAIEECAVATLTESLHHRWALAVLALDFGHAYSLGLLHLTAHVCMNIGSDDHLTVRFPPLGSDVATGINQTCRQVMHATLPAGSI